MTMTSTTHREQYIEGLRLFADFLAERPDYPPTREHYVHASNDADGEAELRRMAAILGAEVKEPKPGGSAHWHADRKFAGLWVTITYCTKESMAEYEALHSYRDNVRATVTA